MALLGIAARLYGLGDKSLWYDEVLTYERARLGLAHLVVDAYANKHYPTWFVLTAPFAWGGLDAFSLRLPAALFGGIWVGLVALIAVSVGGITAGLAAGLLAAFSPVDVQYAQEARSYTLTAAAILVSLWGLLRLTQSHSTMAATGPLAPRMAWLAYTIGAGLALYSLSVAIVWLVAAHIAVIATAWRDRWPAGDWLRNWSLANGAILVAWLPGLIALAVANVEKGLDGLTWIPAPDAEMMSNVLSFLYLYRSADMMTGELLPAAVPGFGLVVAALAAYGIWRGPRGLVLPIALAAMPVALTAISLAQPMLVPRYLLWSTGPWFVLAGLGYAALPRSFQTFALPALAIAAAASLLPYYSAETKPLWNLAAARLARDAAPDDRVLTASGLSRRVMTAYVSAGAPAKIPALTFESLPSLRQSFDDGHTIWVFHGRDSQAPIPSREDFFATWTAAYGPPAETATFGKAITLWRFEKR